MAINGVSPYNSKFRLSGLATGLDTDQMVADLMKVERVPLDKLLQKRQLAEWKRDSYREVTNLLRGLKDEYFSNLKMSANMLSKSMYKKFSVNSVNSATGTASAVVSATAGTEAVLGSHTITVNQLATAAYTESDTSTSGVTADLRARNLTGSSSAVLKYDAAKTFDVSVDGVTDTITLTGTYSDADALAKAIETQLVNLNGKVALSQSGGLIEFTLMGETNKVIQLNEGTGALADLKFSNGQSNQVTQFDFTAGGIGSKDFQITLDGVTKTVTLNGNYGNMAGLVTGLQSAIDTAFGVDPNNVAATRRIVVSQMAGADILKFDTANGASKMTLSSGLTSNALPFLKFNPGESNRLNSAETLRDLRGSFGNVLTFNASNQVTFTINSKQFAFDSNTTLSSMMNQINSDPDAGITIQYDDVSDQFKITSDQLGEGSNLSIVNGDGNFFAVGGASKIDTNSMKIVKGSGPLAAADLNVNTMKFKVTIDGVEKEFTFGSNYATAGNLASAMQNLINADVGSGGFGAGTVSVSALNGVLKIRLNNGSNMTLSSGSANDALGNLKFVSGDTTTGQGHNGRNAKVILDGQSLVRSSNSFTANGVTYTLLGTSSSEQKITLTNDVNAVFDNIKGFIDKYNEVISKINGELSEEHNRDYQPLTEEQKASMKEEDIERWEEKAKSGLLRGDSLLQGIVYKMRSVMFDGISGVNASLSSIGISTGSYEDKGKLIINESKLRNAIQNDPDAVMNLFAKESSIRSNLNITQDQRSTRYKEEGLAFRLFDVVEDNIRTFRDSNGHKGTLLEKAGMTGDASEFDNAMYDQIDDYDERISALSMKLIDKENKYYIKFASLEKMISQMNAQSNWMSSQLGSGS